MAFNGTINAAAGDIESSRSPDIGLLPTPPATPLKTMLGDGGNPHAGRSPGSISGAQEIVKQA
jgi:hypothetical protein